MDETTFYLLSSDYILIKKEEKTQDSSSDNLWFAMDVSTQSPWTLNCR